MFRANLILIQILSTLLQISTRTEPTEIYEHPFVGKEY